MAVATTGRSPGPVPSEGVSCRPAAAAGVAPGLLIATHLRHVDGLRALAVLAVVVYHLNERFLPGGYFGVDVFFVISGFVITKSVLDAHARGRFSILRFYAARIRRIMPAAIAIVASTLVASRLLYTWLEQAQFLDQKPWLAFVHASNYAFANASVRYGDLASFQNPLLHTWSLGVENQYYLVYPVVVWAVLRATASWRALQLVLAAAFVLSLALYVTQADPDAAFYLPQFRFWQIAVGAMAALLDVSALGRLAGPRRVGYVILAEILVVLALAALWHATRSVTLSGATRLAAVTPTLATAAVLVLLTEAERRTPSVRWTLRVLTLPPLVFLGLISYSVYLWHWPIIVFLRAWGLHFDSLTAPRTLLCLALILALSYLSYRLFERPFARVQRLGVLATAILLCVLGSVLLARKLTVDDSFKVPYAAYDVRYQRLLEEHAGSFTSFYGDPTLALMDAAADHLDPRIDGGRIDMLVFGNSHMEQLQLIPANLATRYSLHAVLLGGGGFTALQHPSSLLLLERILDRNPVRYVFVDFTRGAPSVDFLTHQIASLATHHPATRFVVIKDNPMNRFSPASCKDFTRLGALWKRVRGRTLCPDVGWDPASLEDARATEARLDPLLSLPNVYYVRSYYDRLLEMPDTLLPPRGTHDVASAGQGLDGYLLYDDNHYSFAGFRYVEPWILAELEQLGVFREEPSPALP